MGCFWGAQKLFDLQKGVKNTSVGYGGGFTENPTYSDICYKETGHIELVEIFYDDKIISFEKLLDLFFEYHNPFQIGGQGNDTGEQYLSTIFYTNENQKKISEKKIKEIEKKENKKIETKLLKFKNYFIAEEYHQKYLEKHPEGYCHIRI